MKNNVRTRSLEIVLLAILSAIFPMREAVCADKVYKRVDKDGVVHYSTKPSGPESKVADLPPIMRGELKLPESQMLSCGSHGGIDCTAGPDRDGSVVCLDGFRDSAQRFSFSCSAPKLQIVEITPVEHDGSFAVRLRNAKPVAAQKTSVTVTMPDSSTVTLNGPEEVGGFDAAEFRYEPTPAERERLLSNPSLLGLAFRPGLEHVTVNCANCP
ncbi:MAG: DUF4124 domain-containing protein [Deltaproteobacteria bacterium]|nr:DUF4124 domain-containing protein [Deltaproteobacteria bacterium]